MEYTPVTESIFDCCSSAITVILTFCLKRYNINTVYVVINTIY